MNEPAATGGSSSTTGSGNGGSATGGSSSGGSSKGGSANGGYTNGTGSGGWLGSGGNGQTGGNVGSGGNCVARAGLACNAQDICCSTKGLTCGVDGACCKVKDESCSSNAECCSDNCVNNHCALSGASLCLVANYRDRCTEGACCSAQCDFFEGGATKVCQAIEGCKPVGEQCQNWFECCSDYCSNGRCVYEYAPFCQKSGDTCGSDSAGEELCCAGLSCVLGAEGVQRCVPSLGPCVAASGRCRVASDCCPIAREATGHCVFDKGGPATFDPNGNYGTCGTCGDAGQLCKVELDCCVGYTCLGKETGGGLCVAKTTASTCGSQGATCVNGGTGTGGTSGAAGSSGTAATTCCSGYVCDSLTSKCVR